MSDPTTVSAWCTMPPGITSHASQHRLCEQRQASGDIGPCGCPDHHPTSGKDPT